MDDNTTPIVDGEVINTDATVLLSLDEMIKTSHKSLGRMQEEQKKLREMLADGLNSDASYQDLDGKVKEATKARTQVKQQIMQRPGVSEMATKLKDFNTEIKEKKTALSDYVLEYQRLAHVNQIEVEDGEILEIIQSARLVKKFVKK